MIDIPLIDTHVHLWDPQHLRYAWLANAPKINRRFVPADYDRATAPLKIEKMVFVQCDCDPAQSGDEVAWVSGLAKDEPRIAGIVAFAPLEKGDAVEPTLRTLAANPLVKGVRRLLQSEPDPKFCLQPAFIAGLQLLHKYNLSFDICLKGDDQAASVISAIKQCPDVRFIVDHIAKPDIARQKMDPWKAHIRALADLPNVWCKISGLVTEADHDKWTPADLKPYVSHVLDSFGIDRVMFGGDWPVIILAASIPQWVDALDGMTAGLSRAERAKLFHDNAVGFYRLGR